VESSPDTAVWCHFGKAPDPIRWVLIPDPLGEFEHQSLFCTDTTVEAAQIIEWFVLRWQLEVTSQEVRAHLGVETQSQWSDPGNRPHHTPALLGLFSWVTLAANVLQPDKTIPERSAAWYAESLATFLGCNWPGPPTLMNCLSRVIHITTPRYVP
jgi:hypothetical protein